MTRALMAGDLLAFMAALGAQSVHEPQSLLLSPSHGEPGPEPDPCEPGLTRQQRRARERARYKRSKAGAR